MFLKKSDRIFKVECDILLAKKSTVFPDMFAIPPEDSPQILEWASFSGPTAFWASQLGLYDNGMRNQGHVMPKEYNPHTFLAQMKFFTRNFLEMRVFSRRSGDTVFFCEDGSIVVFLDQKACLKHEHHIQTLLYQFFGVNFRPETWQREGDSELWILGRQFGFFTDKHAFLRFLKGQRSCFNFKNNMFFTNFSFSLF